MYASIFICNETTILAFRGVPLKASRLVAYCVVILICTLFA